MTLSQLITYVDGIKPNNFSPATKTMWVNEVEGLVQTEVMLIQSEEIIQYDYQNDADRELLVKAPHDKLYSAYVTAMVDLANGEYHKYHNTMEMFDAFLSEYMRWYALHYRPADRQGESG